MYNPYIFLLGMNFSLKQKRENWVITVSLKSCSVMLYPGDKMLNHKFCLPSSDKFIPYVKWPQVLTGAVNRSWFLTFLYTVFTKFITQNKNYLPLAFIFLKSQSKYSAWYCKITVFMKGLINHSTLCLIVPVPIWEKPKQLYFLLRWPIPLPDGATASPNIDI